MRVSQAVSSTTTDYTWDPTGLGTVIADGTVENVFGPIGLAGQLTGTTDVRAISTSHSYDAVGNLLSTTSPDGTISYGYDALNRQTSMTDLIGTTAWTYNAASETTQVASPESVIAQVPTSMAGTVRDGFD